MTEPTIEHEDAPGRGQFFLRRNGRRCGTLDYTVSPDDVIHIEYVEVAPDARGSGLGRHLVAAAVEWARETHRKVVPICSYAGMVLRTDSSMHDVLA
ncbi:MAG: GNAT family N-acetyltransferase [Vicinamibacterales bacterium]